MAQVHQLFPSIATTYGPERLKILCSAFDGAWEAIAGSFPDASADQDSLRATLASVILSLPCSETADAERIRNVALQVMASRFHDWIHPGIVRVKQQTRTQPTPY